MILEKFYKKAAIAQAYFKLKTGEDLETKVAWSRWRMTRNPDKAILKKVFSSIASEQKKLLR